MLLFSTLFLSIPQVSVKNQKKGRAGDPLLLPGLFFLATAILLTILYYL